MKKIYAWKELTDDGVLKEPDEVGPYYSKESINQLSWGKYGFDTEKEAEDRIKSLYKDHYFQIPADLVLIPIYDLREI